MFQSHTCNFCTVLKVSGLKTNVIHSFSAKRFNLTEICKIQACVHLCQAQCPWCWVQLCVVHFCRVMLSLPMQSCSSLCERVSRSCLCEQVPLQLLCPCAESSLCLRGVCALLPHSHRGWSWLATQVALAALNWFALKQGLYSSIPYCTWLWATTGSCIVLLWPQGINFFFLLSSECLKQPTCLMF